MVFNPEIHHRRSTRLKGFDYSRSGYYFVTISLHDIRCVFGFCKNNGIKLNEIGTTAKTYWLKIPEHFPFVKLDKFIIMTDHIHGIIVLNGDNNVGVRHGEPLRSKQHKYQHIIPKSLGVIINHYKSAVTRWCKNNGYPQFKWQRNYYEHIIQNEQELHEIRKYIQENPLRKLYKKQIKN